MTCPPRKWLARLRRDQSGVAMLEFAFSLPIVLGLGAYGIETANLALVNLRVSQIALNLADNASRVGNYSTLSTQQLREVDINDIMEAVRKQGDSIDLTTRGRVTLSSLENIKQSYDGDPVQRIHWQRCVGLKNGTGYDSSYGTTTAAAGTDATSANAGTTMATGMGDTGAMVNAPVGSTVMFVEINYESKPLFGAWLFGASRVHYVASFIVRDKRDFAQLYNPNPAIANGSKLTCNRYTT